MTNEPTHRGEECRMSGMLLFGLVVAVCIVCGFAWVGSARAEDPTDRRRARIENMDPDEMEQLRRNHERFQDLDPAEQDRLHRLHEALEAEPNAAELRQVMQRYYEWLKTLSPYERAELKDLPIEQRVARIADLQQQQAERDANQTRSMITRRTERFKQTPDDPKSRSLAPEDLDGLLGWIEQTAPRYESDFLESFPENRREACRQELEKVRDTDRYRDFLVTMWLRWHMEHPGEMPPVTEKEWDDLRSKLTDQTRASLESKSRDEQRRTVAHWVRLLVMQEFAMRRMRSRFPLRFPLVNAEELAPRLEAMAPNERGRLLSLPGPEVQWRLTLMYVRSKMLDIPFPELGGPGGMRPFRGGGGGSGPRHPPFGGARPGGRGGAGRLDGDRKFGPGPSEGRSINE